MKVAIVTDFLNQFGGAERVVAALHDIFPNAPIYTSIYDRAKLPDKFKEMNIKTSFMQKIPLVSRMYRYYFWLYPLAFQGFNLDQYDLIISSSSAYAKGIKKRHDALHICYCHNPMRFVWRFNDYMKEEKIWPIIKKLLYLLLMPLKFWDLNSAKGVDCFAANSKTVADRIMKIYGRVSTIINPPIETEFFSGKNRSQGDYYLVVSRLLGYKRIDLAVRAFNRLDQPLKVVGIGPAEKKLKKIAGSKIEFLGQVDNLKLKKLYTGARALIVCGEEDFGMATLEAAASGVPAIAYRAGGAKETIIDGKTGILFEKQDMESLINAVQRYKKCSFSDKFIREHAKKYDKANFRQRMIKLINEAQAS